MYNVTFLIVPRVGISSPRANALGIYYLVHLSTLPLIGNHVTESDLRRGPGVYCLLRPFFETWPEVVTFLVALAAVLAFFEEGAKSSFSSTV